MKGIRLRPCRRLVRTSSAWTPRGGGPSGCRCRSRDMPSTHHQTLSPRSPVQIRGTEELAQVLGLLSSTTPSTTRDSASWTRPAWSGSSARKGRPYSMGLAIFLTSTRRGRLHTPASRAGPWPLPAARAERHRGRPLARRQRDTSRPPAEAGTVDGGNSARVGLLTPPAVPLPTAPLIGLLCPA